ncbi:response regulator transcription factor, partial [Puniceibacterium confluentis]
MRVLLVEDTRDVAEAIAIQLNRSGMACDMATDLDEARGFVAVQGYDVIVLDINLPDGLGTELLQELRGRGLRTPVIMLTALFS